MKSSCGVLGGFPRHARYFVGCVSTDEHDHDVEEDGSKKLMKSKPRRKRGKKCKSRMHHLIYLDPHTSQPVISQDVIDKSDKTGIPPDMNMIQSFHNQQPRAMPITSLDPTLAFCFYFRNQNEFLDFRHKTATLFSNGKFPIFSVAEKRPTLSNCKVQFFDERHSPIHSKLKERQFYNDDDDLTRTEEEGEKNIAEDDYILL